MALLNSSPDSVPEPGIELTLIKTEVEASSSW